MLLWRWMFYFRRPHTPMIEGNLVIVTTDRHMEMTKPWHSMWVFAGIAALLTAVVVCDVAVTGRHLIVPDPFHANQSAVVFDFNGVAVIVSVDGGEAVVNSSVALTVSCYFNASSGLWSNVSHQPQRFAAFLNGVRLSPGASIDTNGVTCNEVHHFTLVFPAPVEPPFELSLVKITEPNFNAGDANHSNYVMFHEAEFSTLHGHRQRTRYTSAKESLASPGALRIEFIGDSITAGYCNLCQEYPANGTNTYAWEDFSRGWPTRVCSNLDAVCHYEAWSGRGLMRNCNDAFPTTMPQIAQRAIATVQASDDFWGVPNLWNTSRFEPHVVVINLGTNDYLCNPILNESLFFETFVETYVGFAESLVSAYNASGLMQGMFLACGPMTNTYCDAVLEVVSRLRLRGSGAFFLNQTTLLTPAESCCGHPSVVADKVLADFTTAMILEAIG